MLVIYEKCNEITDDRIVAALVGMTKAKCVALVKPFEEADRAIQQERVEPGDIKHVKRGKPNGPLDTDEKQRFFVLYDLKTYPTFDVLGFPFGFSGGHAHAHVDRLLPVLRRALAVLGVMPEQAAGTPSAFHNLMDKDQAIVIDGVECACVRPPDRTEQEHQYSGKKRPTVKALVVSDLNRKLRLLCGVVAGSVHDDALMKNVCKPGFSWFRKVRLGLDLGFLGADQDDHEAHIQWPHKQPRQSKKNPNPSLTPTQKQENRRQASTRVVVEHASGGMKTFHGLLHRIRNHLDTVVDDFFALPAGLWNYKIS